MEKASTSSCNRRDMADLAVEVHDVVKVEQCLIFCGVRSLVVCVGVVLHYSGLDCCHNLLSEHLDGLFLTLEHVHVIIYAVYSTGLA